MWPPLVPVTGSSELTLYLVLTVRQAYNGAYVHLKPACDHERLKPARALAYNSWEETPFCTCADKYIHISIYVSANVRIQK